VQEQGYDVIMQSCEVVIFASVLISEANSMGWNNFDVLFKRRLDDIKLAQDKFQSRDFFRTTINHLV
jgi:hypothetical protein